MASARILKLKYMIEKISGKHLHHSITSKNCGIAHCNSYLFLWWFRWLERMKPRNWVGYEMNTAVEVSMKNNICIGVDGVPCYLRSTLKYPSVTETPLISSSHIWDIFESNTTLDVEDTKKARIVSINQIQFDTIDRSSTYSLSV